MKVLSRFLIVAFVVFGVSTQLFAQSEPQSKQQLIEELLTLTQGGFDMRKEFEKGMGLQKENIFRAYSSFALDNEELSEADKARIEKTVRESVDRMVEKINQRVTSEIDFDSLTNEFLFKFYDTNFSIDEIQSIVEFHRTAVGKKIVALSSEMMWGLMNRYETVLGPKIEKIAKEIAEKELEALLPEILGDIEIEPCDIDSAS